MTITTIAPRILTLLMLATLSLSVGVASAQADIPAKQIPEHTSPTYSKAGADTCLTCHDQDSQFPVMAIFKGPHGNQGTHKGPFSANALQCETCHGPAGNHDIKRLRKGKKRDEMIAFRRNEAIPVEQKNAICLGCHQKNSVSHWQGSEHQVNDIACNDCHQIHTSNDGMVDKSAQVQRCGSCHVSAKQANHKASHHPLSDGQMGCSDCHRPHDANADALLVGDQINETCYQCHAEKRGPFLWQHQPVTDSCINCHQPHGSNQQNMLTQRAPFLCQSCHSSAGHVSFAANNDNLLTGSRPSAFLVGRSCANCHSQIHGSNHPAGSRLQR